MSITDELNRVQYVAEDFATYRAAADTFFQQKYPDDFNDLILTNLGNAMMDQLAFAMQSLSFMMNRRASEMFMDTALLNKSITKLARTLGYPIAPASPATSTATVVFPDAPYAFPVPIQQGFQFQGPGDTIYEYASIQPTVLQPGQTTLSNVPIREGQTKQISFRSTGDANQQFSINGVPDGQFLYKDGLVILVDGVAWTRYDILRYENSNTFEVLFSDAPPKLRFGDGIAGNIPPQGSEVSVIYRHGKGLSGAIGSNQLTGPVNQLVINGLAINMSLSNAVADVGSDPEDIRHVKAFASSFFRTQSAAVIKSDYDTISQLRPGVALADAQIMRGVDEDITIQAEFAFIHEGEAILQGAVSGIMAASVSGLSAVGVSGLDLLSIQGLVGLAVSGIAGLFVSGESFLGTDVSGNVTGQSLLGIGGVSGLTVIGQSGLFIGGLQSVGVSGLGEVGISDLTFLQGQATSGISLVESGVSGLASYLSQVFSDTSKANNVQVIVLGVDSNNRYIAPSPSILADVQTTLQGMCDAVVTVTAVDGSSKLVPADIEVTLGISQTAVQSDVEAVGLAALISSTNGLLRRRKAGVSLYRSDIQSAIEDANNTSDIAYVNVKITAPQGLLDADGNLIISAQQIIQDGNVSVKVVKRFTT